MRNARNLSFDSVSKVLLNAVALLSEKTVGDPSNPTPLAKLILQAKSGHADALKHWNVMVAHLVRNVRDADLRRPWDALSRECRQSEFFPDGQLLTEGPRKTSPCSRLWPDLLDHERFLVASTFAHLRSIIGVFAPNVYADADQERFQPKGELVHHTEGRQHTIKPAGTRAKPSAGEEQDIELELRQARNRLSAVQTQLQMGLPDNERMAYEQDRKASQERIAQLEARLAEVQDARTQEEIAAAANAERDKVFSEIQKQAEGNALYSFVHGPELRSAEMMQALKAACSLGRTAASVDRSSMDTETWLAIVKPVVHSGVARLVKLDVLEKGGPVPTEQERFKQLLEAVPEVHDLFSSVHDAGLESPEDPGLYEWLRSASELGSLLEAISAAVAEDSEVFSQPGENETAPEESSGEGDSE